MNIVLKKGAEKSSITCTKNVQAQVDNQTKKAISVKIADGTTLKVESGESCTITPKGKKEDTSGEDKTDGKDQKTDDTSDGNASSGSSSSGNSSGGTTVETPSKLTEADLLKQMCIRDSRGVGRKVLSMLIGWLFRNGYSKIVLDTNLTNTRAQHVYESLGFRKVRTNIDSWKDQLGQLQSSVDYELVEKDFVSYE